MDKETAQHLHEVWATVVIYKEGIAIMLSALIAAFLFWLRNAFVTRQSLNEFDSKNEKKHGEIEEKVESLDEKVDHVAENVAWMRGKMERLHPDD